MIIQPKIRGFICTTAHPTGCYQAVAKQIAYVKKQGPFPGPKRVLVIGASTGYGLASRIVASFGGSAKTIGVFFEKPADDKRTASAGWYNSAAFESIAKSANHYAKSVNGDAFSLSVKEQVANLIAKDFGQVDLIIYSLASPRRTHPLNNQTFSSVLKPIGQSFISKTVDAFKGEVKEIKIDPANEEEIANTIAVMGGEDWQMWIDFLRDKNLLAPKIKTIAYSYLGPKLTHAIYKEGTIGQAKNHLKNTADQLTEQLKILDGEAMVSVNKAVVTQASAAIPVVPLYISLLFKIMKKQGSHEGCIEQIYRLFKNYLYAKTPPLYDKEGYIRLDDLEMQDKVQQEIAQYWPQITNENLNELTDVAGYRQEFYHLFGFAFPEINYDTEVNPNVTIPSMEE